MSVSVFAAFRRHKNPVLHIVKAITAFACLTIALSARAEEEPVIYVSVAPQKYLLERIAGDTLQIEVLVQPGHNPHSYDPSARQMARLAKADMLMSTGVPFEQVWLPRIRRLNPGLQIVDTLSPNLKTDLSEDEHKHDHDSDNDHAGHDDHGHEHSGQDPHVWMDPIKAIAQAGQMKQALAKAYPALADQFNQGYGRLEAELTALDAEVHLALEAYEGRTFMVFHPAWGHFAARYHVEQVAIEYQGKSPSARQLVSLSERAKAEKIKVILVQEQFNQKPAERIAANIDARVVQANPLPEDLPAAIRSLTQQLLESWR